MRDKDAGTSSGFARPSERRLTPADVQQKEFRVSFRGYNERDVDEFLDLVTEELQRYETELMRVRSERASIDPASLDVGTEARRILDDARQRADAIVREAEARAAGIPTASGAETRAVVAPYLNREREFLQDLGALVQQHANTIRTMVEEARRRTEPSASGAPEPPSATAEAEAMSSSGVAEPSSDSAPPDEARGIAPEPAAAGEEAENDVVVIASGQPATSPAETPDDEREPEGVRSLRELFWGED